MTDTATLERPAAQAAETVSFSSLATMAAPDPTALSAGPAAMLRMAKSFSIETDDDYALAAEELQAVKAKSKALEEKRTGIVGPLNKAVKAINDLFRGPLTALEQAEKVLKDGMLGYDAAKARIAAQKKREAEEAAAAERKKLEEEAAAIEREAAAKRAHDAAVERERAAAALAEQNRLAEEARAAAAAGDAEAAAAREAEAKQAREREEAEAAERTRLADIAQQEAAMAAEATRNVAAVIVAPIVAPARTKVGGISTATTYDFEVTDLLELVKHIAEHPEHLSLVAADTVKLRGLVKSLGANTKLPGVRVFSKQTMRAA